MAEKANKNARNEVANQKGQRNLEGKQTKAEPIEQPVELPAAQDWISFLKDSKSNANSVISPSKFPEGDYEFVSNGKCEVDYKDGNGVIEVSYLNLKSLDDNRITKLKVTPTLVDVIEELEFDILRNPFHYRAKAKSEFKVIISITLLERDLKEKED